MKLIAFRDGIGKDLIIYDDGGKLHLKPNTDYHLKVMAEGEHIRVYLDGKLVIDTMDPTFSEGYAGLNVWNSTSLFNEVKFEIVK